MLISSGRVEICIDRHLKQADFITWTLLLPPWRINKNFHQQPPSPVFAPSHFAPLYSAFVTFCSTQFHAHLFAPCPQNLITAWLANLELIHFRWRWLITPGRRVTSVTRQQFSQWIKELMLTVQPCSWQRGCGKRPLRKFIVLIILMIKQPIPVSLHYRRLIKL